MSEKKLSDEERGVMEQFLLPYFHLNKRFPLFPGKNNPQAEAILSGISLEELALNRKNATENAKQAALELLKEDAVIDMINELPFDGEETIVAFGDSATEDDQGWFAILKHLLELSIEDADFTFINSGVANDTTSDALRRLDRDVLLHEPDWVFVSFGTFDVQRLNIAPHRTLIPLSETWENLNTIHEVINEQVSNPILWITPSPVINQLLSEHPLYQFSIEEADLQQVIELVAGKVGGIVDPKAKRMGEKEPEVWNYIADGLHPSLSGHLNTTREVLKTLVEVKAKS